MGEPVRLQSDGEDSLLGHFNDLAQLGHSIDMGQSWIFGLQQPRRNPERFHLLADPDQFLFFLPDDVVRVFHWGGPLFEDSGLVPPVGTNVSEIDGSGNLPEVHLCSESHPLRKRSNRTMTR